MMAIYGVDPSKPSRGSHKYRAELLESPKPFLSVNRPKQLIQRPNQNLPAARIQTAKNEKKTPISYDDFPMNFNLAARTTATGSLLQMKDLFKAADKQYY